MKTTVLFSVPAFLAPPSARCATFRWPPRPARRRARRIWTCRSLERPPDLIEDPPDLRLVVGNAELPFDHFPHALSGPHLAAKAVMLRALLQKSRELLPILVREALVRAGTGAASERLLASLTGPTHPLAHRPVRYAERLGQREVCFHPFCLSSNARRRRFSFQSAESDPMSTWFFEHQSVCFSDLSNPPRKV